MQQYMQDIRGRLTGLRLLAEKTYEAEKRILQSAEKRLERVQADIDDLRPKALSGEAAERYQRLIVERGKLHQIIERARANL